MTLNLQQVAHTLAALDIAGLDIMDLHEIPAAAGVRGPAILIPLPAFVTDFSMERNSFGGGSTAKMTVTYTLHYRLLYKSIGEGRVMTLEVFDGLTGMIGLILDRVLLIDVFDTGYTEVVDVIPLGVTNMGIINDPSDLSFYGCDFAFQIMEFVN